MFAWSRISKLAAMALASTCLATSQADACTGIMLKAKDGGIVHGRTLEFGIKVEIFIAVVPKGYAFTGTTPSGKGLEYTSKYAAVGAFAFENPALLDGVNEAGLAAGTFYFPGYAGYTATTKENQSKSLSPAEFPNWLLTQFATVDEVKAGINSIVIAPTVVAGWGSVAPPFHYVVYDKSGKSITIEPVDGKFIVYDNPLGVMTNSPSFDWHLTNLRNYINLTPRNVAPLKVDGMELAPFGQGSGMVGLPGDFTPPSRFVRASIFETTATPSDNADQAVLQAFHILNQFDIPVGVARQVEGGVTYTDYTLFTCVRDPQSLKYYSRSYEDQTIRVVDLKAFDLNAKGIKKAPTVGKQPIVDMTKELK